jgi:Helicase conserved C-terminal domain
LLLIIQIFTKNPYHILIPFGGRQTLDKVMSYPEDLRKTSELDALLGKKEFAQLRLPTQRDVADLNPSVLSAPIFSEGHLFLHSQQQFIRNFIGPNNTRKRVLGKHFTGTGKTITALVAAMAYTSVYKQMYQFAEETPLVYIIGFSKSIFQRELLRHPEFGFISKEEMAEVKRLRSLAESKSLADRNALAEYESRIRKRLTKKYWGGFFKFFGYKEFFNRMFNFSEAYLARRSTPGEGETRSEEEFIVEGLRDGSVTVNYELINSFANSLVICDEIHNVYNSMEMNNYGIALHTLFNVYDLPDKSPIYDAAKLPNVRGSQLRVIFLTATPINNSPTEIVDLLNLLVPISELPKQTPLRKENFFINDRDLKPGALETIGYLTRGYISFLRDMNPKYFPQSIMEGEPIAIPPKYRARVTRGYTGKNFPYLKFIRCVMSKLHLETYREYYHGAFSPDGQSLLDLVIPNPGVIAETKAFGLFRSKDIRYSLNNATQAWKDKNEIDFVKSGNHHVITGEFMRLGKLEKYSTKYAAMMQSLLENLRNGGGKVQIAHEYVKMSGVLFIQEVLRHNGFIDETSTPIDSTLCSRCGIPRSNHKKFDLGGTGVKSTTTNHEYQPARFVVIFGDVDHTTLEHSIEKFTAPENVNGEFYRVIIGSKILNERIDLNAIQEIYIMDVPPNIPTLLQKFGRAIRKNSHALLPPSKRKVHIKIFVSSLPRGSGDLAYEELRYFENLQDYLVMQEIDRVLNANAIDAVINRSMIFPPPTSRGPDQNDLGILYFKPTSTFGKQWLAISQDREKIRPSRLDLSTFYPYHADEEINTLIYIIKRLFIEQSPAWTYEDLWDSVRKPPFDVYVNPELFLEDDFVIALTRLTDGAENYVNPSNLTESSLSNIDRLFNPNDITVIATDGRECRITKHQDLYILLPIEEPVLRSESAVNEYQFNMLGVEASELTGRVVLEPDNWFRREISPPEVVFPITNQLQSSNISYNQMKYKFYNQFRDTPVNEMPTIAELYNIDFHIRLVEDSIKYVFNIYTIKNMPFSELHTFYFKMLYFYDRLEMIIFADELEDSPLVAHYRPYFTRSNIAYGIHAASAPVGRAKKLREDHDYNAFLMTSIIKSSGEQKPFDIARLNEFLGRRATSRGVANLESMKLDKQIPTRGQRTKVFSNLLPVGHFLTTDSANLAIPKIYIPPGSPAHGRDEWAKIPDFAQHIHEPREKENNIVIGYYERNPTGIDVKFKIRHPKQKIEKFDDSRLVEKGAICSTKRKEELADLAHKLGIKRISTDGSIKNMCNIIKLTLLNNEMNERRKWKHLSDKQRETATRTRWFYFHFELGAVQ